MDRKKLTLEMFNSLTAKQQAFIFENKLEKRKYNYRTKKPRRYYGVGIVDVSFPVSIVIEGKRVTHAAFRAWNNMLRRAYYTKNKQRYNCTVCEEWHAFSNFLAWWWENAPNSEHYSRYQLDKDHENNIHKVYCSEYCFFVPQCVNLQDRRSSKTGKLFNIN